MKTILVTGGAGYIGSHVVKMLLENKYNVLTLDNLSTGFLSLVKGNLIIGDFGDIHLLEDIFKKHDIEVVMHFAASSIVKESNENPLMYYKNNVSNTINMLHTMMKCGVRNFIFSSSASVYGNTKNIPINENNACNPNNVYGKTKLIIENVLKECKYIRSVSLRYFNAAGADTNIGERHNPETHIIPLLFKSKTFEIYGTDYDTPDGTAIRDYVHVNDIANAHILALSALDKGYEIYNIGNNKGYSVKEIIKKVKEKTKKDINIIESSRRECDPEILVANSTKIRKELGWKPKQSDINTIIDTAWKWYKRAI